LTKLGLCPKITAESDSSNRLQDDGSNTCRAVPDFDAMSFFEQATGILSDFAELPDSVISEAGKNSYCLQQQGDQGPML
jgi:hypothetical protein